LTRGKRVAGVLVLCAALLSGCGGDGQSAAEKRKMTEEFNHLDILISDVTTGGQPVNQRLLEQLSHRYAAKVFQYKDDLGSDQAKDLLGNEASYLEPWCPACVQILLEERAKY
jgi:hypothetical protein